MALSQATLERQEGDIAARRRKAADMLNRGVQFRGSKDDAWSFGPLVVRWSSDGSHLLAESPDGDVKVVDVGKEDVAQWKRAAIIERELRALWKSWLDEL